MMLKQKALTVLYPNDGKTKNKVTDLSEVKNSIFLAGPCSCGDDKWDWRDEAISILEKLEFDGIILNPTNRYFSNINLELQTSWEIEALHKASIIVFWIPRSKEHPAMTTNYEIAQWWGKPGVYVGWPKDAWKNEYAKIRCDKVKQKVYDDLEKMLKDVVEDLNRQEIKTFFTADTHFSQERTLNLSRRPFIDVQDMDLTMISNWNKIVRKNDLVIHLGDFGNNFDYLKCLNFGELLLVPGNYEFTQYNNIKGIKNALGEYKNAYVLEPDELRYKDDVTGKIYRLTHKPIYDDDSPEAAKDDFFLGGHIHGRTQYKRNYVDVGVDCNHYALVSEELIRWYRDAVEKYVDENVFTDRAYKGKIEEKH